MRNWIVTSVLMAVAVAASAQTVYVPAAANAEGANQTRWRTDLQVKARGSEGATIVVELLERDTDNSSPLGVEQTLAAGESLRLANLLETSFGFSGAGALRLTPTSGQILVTSRTYNDDPGGTYGQTVPAVAEDAATPFGSHVTLIQLSRSSDPEEGFRTNVGLVNVTGATIAVEIDLFLADGSSLGTVTRELLPYDVQQVNDVFHVAGADDVADGYAMVHTTTEGGRFIVYASVVDNRSGDAVLLLGQPDEIEEPTEQEWLVVFESFTRNAPNCVAAGPVIDQLAAEYADRPVVFIEQEADRPLGDRLSRWWEAYSGTGSVYLPFVMVDSGRQISSGMEDFETVYSAMVEASLDREPLARIDVSPERDADTMRFVVQLTNTSGFTLSAANRATLHAILWEEDTKTVTERVVIGATSTSIDSLGDGQAATYELVVTVPGASWGQVRSAILADYFQGSHYDTLQAVAVD